MEGSVHNGTIRRLPSFGAIIHSNSLGIVTKAATVEDEDEDVGIGEAIDGNPMVVP
jgi:hypothetical protein